MTPKEKAKELFDSYWYCLMQSDINKRHYWSKQCALIAVDEIYNSGLLMMVEDEQYWYDVKQEIELL